VKRLTAIIFYKSHSKCVYLKFNVTTLHQMFKVQFGCFQSKMVCYFLSANCLQMFVYCFIFVKKCNNIVLYLFQSPRVTALFFICFNLQRLRCSFRRSDGVHQRVVVRPQLHADEQTGRRRHPNPERIQQRIEDWKSGTKNSNNIYRLKL
jgi:hypothetical protein